MVLPVAAAVNAVAGLTDVVTAVESVGAVVAVVVTDATTCACCPHPNTIELALSVSLVFTGPSTVPGFTLRSAVIVLPVASVIVNVGAYPTSPHGCATKLAVNRLGLSLFVNVGEITMSESDERMV